MREHDPPSSTEGASSLVVDEKLVVFIDVGGGVAIFPFLPVIRVILPHDRLQADRIGYRTNPILLPTNMSATVGVRNKDTYIYVSVGRAPAGWGNACDELDGLQL